MGIQHLLDKIYLDQGSKPCLLNVTKLSIAPSSLSSTAIPSSTVFLMLFFLQISFPGTLLQLAGIYVFLFLQLLHDIKLCKLLWSDFTIFGVFQCWILIELRNWMKFSVKLWYGEIDWTFSRKCCLAEVR